MPPRKPSTPPIRRKARGHLQKPLCSWFQTDLQVGKEKYPQFYPADFYYKRMIEGSIFIDQEKSFELRPCILRELDQGSLSPAKGIIFSYLLIDALRSYAQSEWAWLHKEPGEFAREFSQLAKAFELWQGIIFEDGGQLVKLLRKTARQVRKKWETKNAQEQAFLEARRRLIQKIRLLVEEFLPLPKRTKSAVTNRLCAYLLVAFNIRTSLNQDVKTLLQTVRQDRQRNEKCFREFDDRRRLALKGQITILEQYPCGNADKNPFPNSWPSLPLYRISPTPPEFIFSWPPLLDLSDSNIPDFHELY